MSGKDVFLKLVLRCELWQSAHLPRCCFLLHPFLGDLSFHPSPFDFAAAFRHRLFLSDNAIIARCCILSIPIFYFFSVCGARRHWPRIFSIIASRCFDLRNRTKRYYMATNSKQQGRSATKTANRKELKVNVEQGNAIREKADTEHKAEDRQGWER